MNVTVILPSLNPDEKMLQVVNGLVEYGFHRIIIVNDGSDEQHTLPFEQAARLEQCVVLKHSKNLGKGRALKTAFNYFLNHPDGDAGVVTVDGDNQHTTHDIAACAKKMLENPDSVVLGVRDFSLSNVPKRSRFGNQLTSFIFKSACGLNVSDTQTGLRAIPLKHVYEFLDVSGERFEYETNMLLDIKTKDIPLLEVKIQTVYIEENKTSHFNPIRDSIRIYSLLFKFLFASLSSSLIDIVLFWLFSVLLNSLDLSLRILCATVGARILSSLYNYAVNKNAVFKSSGNVKTTLAKYYLLCVLQMGASYGLVYLFTSLLSCASVIIKIFVDTFLFFISFRIQREWIFSNKERK